MNGLSSINVELTSRCNKSCWMCGRRKIEKEHPELADWGDMPFEMVERIAAQVPAGVMVQLHNNGEPLLYPKLAEAIKLFGHCHTSLDTNGSLLVERANDLINNLDSLAVSIIPSDPDRRRQLAAVEAFLALKKTAKPITVFRVLAGADDMLVRFIALKHRVNIARRVLHSPMGSYKYQAEPVIPEQGICLEMLHKLSIDRWGNVSPCVRFDPHRLNHIANVENATLEEAWASDFRRKMIEAHKAGERSKIQLCAACEYWGIPRG